MSWPHKARFGSIRARLLLLLLGGLGTLMLALFLLLDFSIDRQIFGRLDATLLGRARGVVVLLESHSRDDAWQELHELVPEYATGGHTDFVQIWDAAGRTLLSSASNAGNNLQRPPATVPANAPLFYDLRLPDGHRGRAVGLRFAMPGRVDEAVLVVAEEREQVDQLERRVHLALVIGVVGMGLLAALLSVLAVRGGLRPLLAFAADTGPDGAPRVEPLPVARMPSELRPFADALNAAFARLQAALGRERRFARDVAHELRTPLAETRMAVELAGRGSPSPQVLAGALASIDRMQRCIDGLLSLSRYEAGIDQAQVEPLELVDLLRRSLALAATPAGKREVTLAASLPEECWVMSDPALLERIVDNLLLNAVEYAPAGSTVQLELVIAEERGCTLRLGNAAPQLAPDDVERLGERFWRKSEAREASHHGGLGLALAGTLAGLLGLRLAFTLEQGTLLASLGPLRPMALPENPAS